MTSGDATTAPSVPRIVGTPSTSLVDEPVYLRLMGLRPGDVVVLRARMRDDSNTWWESASTFRADTHGTVDLASQAPQAGSYDGADPMGFLWSMAPAAGERVSSPFVKTTLEPYAVELVAQVDGETLAAASLTRLSVAPGVSRMPVRDDGLVGTFFVPAGLGPFPAVIVVGGSGGGLSESSAALLASHGYASLALAYFRAEHLPTDLVRIPLEYFETAMQWVQAQDVVDAERLAVAGTSRGGELVLLLGSRYPAITAVIGNVPSSVVYGGVAGAPEAEGHLQPAWTYRGEAIPFLRSRRGEVVEEAREHPDEPLALTPMFLRSLEDVEQVRQVSIPVERIAGPVLLISGKEDAMWPSAVYSERVMERLAEHRHPYPDQHWSYDGAGHSIGPPYAPTTITSSLHPVTHRMFALGGNPKDAAFARADAWSRVLQFLDIHLKRGQ
jgi:dienelactone hydrolase